MPQEQTGLKRISGFGLIAAFGLITMSSNIVDNSATSMSIKPDYSYEAPVYSFGEDTLYNSSMLSKQAIGDIVSLERMSGYVQKHEKINVNLQITKISKHVSSFDFEEEYEEI